LIVDAISCANQLKEQNPEAFQFLATKSIPSSYYVCMLFFTPISIV